MEVNCIRDAASDLVSVLDVDQKILLGSMVFNSQIEGEYELFSLVIKRYGLGKGESALERDIANRHPDEYFMKGILSDSDEPIFEAKVILKEAQELLRSKAV